MVEEVEQTYTAENSGGTRKSRKPGLYLGLFLVFIFVAVLVYFSNSSTKPHSIEKVSIIGNSIVSDSDLLYELNFKDVINSKKSPNLLLLKSGIERNPYIQSAYLYQKNSSELIVEVRERTPAAILINESGDLSFMSTDCYVLPYRLLGKLPDMPVVRGVWINGKINKTALHGAYNIINSLSIEQFSRLFKGISEISFNPVDYTFSLYMAGDGLQVLLGSLKDINDKLNFLKIFWQKVIPSNDVSKFEYLDLRWQNQLVVKYKTAQPFQAAKIL
jgi:cell division protein FtsQ